MWFRTAKYWGTNDKKKRNAKRKEKGKKKRNAKRKERQKEKKGKVTKGKVTKGATQVGRKRADPVLCTRQSSLGTRHLWTECTRQTKKKQRVHAK